MSDVGGSLDDNDTFIPLSALQHAVYCPRQAALIHIERMWAENRLTAEGTVVHLAAHEPGARRQKGVRRVTALPLVCQRLGLTGTADLVEFHAASKHGASRETPYPVEFKRGKPKRHRADEVQLCAQALCLEEMFGQGVPEGALYYAEPKRRTIVTFDTALRALTEDTAALVRVIFESGQTPPPIYKAEKCRACSLLDLCRPKALARPVLAWRQHQLAALLADGDPP